MNPATSPALRVSAGIFVVLENAAVRVFRDSRPDLFCYRVANKRRYLFLSMPGNWRCRKDLCKCLLWNWNL